MDLLRDFTWFDYAFIVVLLISIGYGFVRASRGKFFVNHMVSRLLDCEILCLYGRVSLRFLDFKPQSPFGRSIRSYFSALTVPAPFYWCQDLQICEVDSFNRDGSTAGFGIRVLAWGSNLFGCSDRRHYN